MVFHRHQMAGHFESGILLLFRRRSPGFLCPASLPFYVSFSVSLESIRISRREGTKLVIKQKIVKIVGIRMRRGEGAVTVFPGSFAVVEVVVIGVGMRRSEGAEFIYIHIHIVIVIVVYNDNSQIYNLPLKSDAVYDLSGRPVSATSHLPKGMYISNGKKVMK